MTTTRKFKIKLKTHHFLLLLVPIFVSLSVVFYSVSIISQTTEPLTHFRYPLLDDTTHHHRLNTEETNKKGQQEKKGDTTVRMIWGIFTTMNNPYEFKRRQTIRQTYLQCDTKRICPIQNATADCHVIYAFVVGANPTGSKLLLDFNETYPIILPTYNTSYEENNSNIKSQQNYQSRQSLKKDNRKQQQSPIGTEPSDIVYLNIQENMNEGKSETWLKYATLLSQQIRFSIDYVAKIDSDTLVDSMNILKFVQEELPKYPTRIYGGWPSKIGCLPEYESTICSVVSNPVFFGGRFYFLSLDLANYVTTNVMSKSNRTLLSKLVHEDAMIGAQAQSHPLGVSLHLIADGLWYHPVKKTFLMQYLWNKNNHLCHNDSISSSYNYSQPIIHERVTFQYFQNDKNATSSQADKIWELANDLAQRT